MIFMTAKKTLWNAATNVTLTQLTVDGLTATIVKAWHQDGDFIIAASTSAMGAGEEEEETDDDDEDAGSAAGKGGAAGMVPVECICVCLVFFFSRARQPPHSVYVCLRAVSLPRVQISSQSGQC